MFTQTGRHVHRRFHFKSLVRCGTNFPTFHVSIRYFTKRGIRKYNWLYWAILTFKTSIAIRVREERCTWDVILKSASKKL